MFTVHWYWIPSPDFVDLSPLARGEVSRSAGAFRLIAREGGRGKREDDARSAPLIYSLAPGG